MPRRQQYKKKNKRHRRGRWDEDSQSESHDFPMSTSLEEDLRQQRIRHQQRQKLQEVEKNENSQENKTKDECDNHDIGFQPPSILENSRAIATITAETKHLILKGSIFPESTATRTCVGVSDAIFPPSVTTSVIRLPPSFLIRHIEQTSPLLSIHNRNNLRRLWSTQHHLENLTIKSRAASLYCKSKWPQHHHSDLRCSWDLSCKQRLHPSARTFDVAMLGSDPTPTIATIFQDGWGLLRRKSHHKIRTIKAPPAYAIRMHEGSSSCGMIVRQAGTGHHHNGMSSSYSFRWYKLPHATSYIEANLPRPVTDFCFGKDIALFSCPRYSARSGEMLNPLFLPLVEVENSNNGLTYYDNAVRTINIRNFPQSDALRIEMMCEQQEKLVAFGHRNGQVSILDLRASGTVCSILQYEESVGSRTDAFQPRPLGSVSDLGFLLADNCCRSSSGHGVLVKRSFGSCQLHDLRKVSSSASSGSNNGNHTSATVVFNMGVPPNEINHMLSANCNGFAVDPNSNQTVVSPYVSEPTGDALLGVWSLETGHMVGSRLLLANHSQNRDSTTVHAEICSRTTPSMQPNGTDGDSSFGLWLKCGAITNGKLRSRVGSLHQISIPGRWKNDG